MACRICLEDKESGPLLSVCNCDGSCKYVHQHCLETWIDTSQNTQCELCCVTYTHTYRPTRPIAEHGAEHRVTRMREQTNRDCLMLLVSSCWCGMFHGCLLAMDVWRGYKFKDNLVFGCIIFNVYHACIWIAILKLKQTTALVSMLWMFSVTVGAWMTCLLLNYVNNEMVRCIYLNGVVSLLGLVLSIPDVQKCFPIECAIRLIV